MFAVSATEAGARGAGGPAREDVHSPGVQQQPGGLGSARPALKQGAPTPRPQSCSCAVGCSQHPGLHSPDARSTLPHVPRSSLGGAPLRGGLDPRLPLLVPVQVAPQRGRWPEGPPGPGCLPPSAGPSQRPAPRACEVPAAPPPGSARPPVSCGLSSWALGEGQILTAEAPLDRTGDKGPARPASQQSRGRAGPAAGTVGRAQVASALPARCSVTRVDEEAVGCPELRLRPLLRC